MATRAGTAAREIQKLRYANTAATARYTLGAGGARVHRGCERLTDDEHDRIDRRLVVVVRLPLDLEEQV